MEDLFASVKNMRQKYREIFKSCFAECINKIDNLKSDDEVSGFIERYFKEVCEKRALLLENRNKFCCSLCGDCCKLACSEFSPQELQEKAKNGDNFATQFLSVFIPYDSKEDVRKINPDYIEMLEKAAENDVYFYHCPKVTEDNKCSDYENRPQICKDFPDNPLALLPKFCGYVKWKEEVENEALKLHALIEILSALRKE